jgi:hypothetical protein
MEFFEVTGDAGTTPAALGRDLGHNAATYKRGTEKI